MSSATTSRAELARMRHEPDERDWEIIRDRLRARAARSEPLTGDFIRCADDVYLRIAYVWRGDDWTGNAQTADGAGSYHLHESGGCSMSGSLDSGVPLERLTPMVETREGSAWIFHHGYAGADRGRYFTAEFRCWAYDGPSSDAGYQPPAVSRDQDGATTYSRLYVASLDREAHERTCGYWYTVTCGAMAHTAFSTRAGLDRWLSERGLKLENDLLDRHTRIIGSYRERPSADVDAFYAITALIETAVLSNAQYTLGKITEDESGVRTVHYLTAYVKARQVFDYQRTREQMS